MLREYALIADGERGALVGPRGDIAWLCAPGWSSDAVFSTLLGGGGCYAVTPVEQHHVWGGYYEPGTLIWRSRWVTDSAIIECREALALPADPHRAVLLRRIIAARGTARLDVLLHPAAGFGRHRPREIHRRGGVWTCRTGDLWLSWSGAASAREDAGVFRTLLSLREGESWDLVLEVADAAPEQPTDPGAAARRRWRETELGWSRQVPDCTDTAAPRDAAHAYAVMRGLTAASGAMVAAPTTSLPERAAEGRNYDYRYAWIRDQCYAGQAVAAHGGHPLLDDAVRFVSERILADGPDLRPAYTVDGRSVPDERPLPLPGYPGGAGRAGNRVNRQFQLDTLGECLLLFAAAGRRGRLDGPHWPAVEQAVRAIEQRHRDADAGIWELGARRWAHSRLTCAAGLRAIAGQAPAPVAGRWASLADRLLADVNADCLHPSGRWQRAPDDPRVDAALLLPTIRGALPPSDPRSRATLAAVRQELSEDGYVYRYRLDGRELGCAEGAFLLCGFLMALATHQQDDPSAGHWFERNRAGCGPPGLFSEEFDVRQRQLRGNLPQAFVHALLLESASRLARPWDG
ncbi:glycoside hydrolase family 15 protein [Plantactinospora sp. KBS50]|uniref:glycoside hydrolase family 15 protein n=1 Tax=Plantactinospora sp. KBS50 TaxID=2024580 RepID=UPI0018DF22B5